MTWSLGDLFVVDGQARREGLGSNQWQAVSRSVQYAVVDEVLGDSGLVSTDVQDGEVVMILGS